MSRSGAVVLALALAAVGPTAVGAQEAGAPTEIVEIFHLAVASGVAEVATAVLADDLLVWEMDGAVYDRAAYLDVGLAEEITRCSGRTMEVTAQRAFEGDDVAVVTSRYRLVAADGEAGPEILETLSLSRRDGEWLISHVHRSDSTGG